MQLTWETLNDQLIKNATKRRVPVSCSFELTSRCNLQCKMCYVCQSVNDQNALRGERTAKEWISMAEQVRDAGVLFLVLTGGEVLLRKDFREIYESISNMGFNLQIYTNATMVTPDLAKWIGRIPPSRVSITLYGASRETYERVCGNADGFDKAIRGIDLLLSENIPMEIKTTVIKGNASEFEKIAALIEERKVRFGLVNYISPRREGSNSDPIGERLSPCERVDYDSYVEAYSIRKMKEHLTINTKLDDFDSTMEKPAKRRKADDSFDQNDPFFCLAGKSGFWVSWDGRMLPCGLLTEPCTYPFEQGFIKAWEEIKFKCADIPNCLECLACSVSDYCERCPGRLMTETGSFDKPAPYLCEIAKLTAKRLGYKDYTAGTSD